MSVFRESFAVACQVCGEKYQRRLRCVFSVSGYRWSDLASVERIEEPAFLCCRACKTVAPQEDWHITPHEFPERLPFAPAASHKNALHTLGTHAAPFVSDYGGDAMLLRLYLFRRYPRGSLEHDEHDALEAGLIEYLWMQSEPKHLFLLGEVCRRSSRFEKSHEIFDALALENFYRNYALQQIEFCDKKSTARQILRPRVQADHLSRFMGYSEAVAEFRKFTGPI